MEQHHCRDLLKSLSDYIDGDVGPELCLEIERHMAGCENCRVVVDTLKKTVYLYHSVQEPQKMPGDVRERLYRSLDLEQFLPGDS
jgi:predicted anti-sigma-YlaC factor YlaD